MSASRLLNLGCGRRVHAAWVNVDVVAAAAGVQVHDLRKGIPFPDGAFDAVYHSHLLEHLDRGAGAALLRECRRVLAPGGVIRVVVPDLEGIARAYLATVEQVRRGEPGASERHAWMVLELLDQVARHRSGGEVPAFLARASDEGLRFARERCGTEVDAVLADRRAASDPLLARVLRTRGWPRVALATLLGALGGERFRVGAFRNGGEAHLLMYDACSLEAALRDAGFGEFRTTSAAESAIPGWAEYGLDADATGKPHKPDSLFAEARVSPGGSR